MVDWKRCHGWMKYDSLDVNLALSGSFTIGYRFKDGFDEWTRRFNGFKNGNQAARKGGKNLMTVAIPHLLENMKVDKLKMAFVPALTSREERASNEGVLSWIAEFCGEYFSNADFAREAIRKDAHESLRPHNIAKRQVILDAANFRAGRIDAEIIFVIDDFITTGSTLSRIARTIRASNREVEYIYGIAFGKNETLEFHRNRHNTELTNDHVPDEWADEWKRGEKANELPTSDRFAWRP